mgnify:FL=1
MGLVLSTRKLSLLAGVVVAALVAVHWTARLQAESSQTRTISLYNIHTKETLTVEYKKDGKYVPAAMEQINWILRDWRKNEVTRMDPELIDLLWEMHAELGSKEPIHIISGYRSRSTNEMLRKTRGGQASQSRHILGKAADVHFPDVPIRRLRYSALVRERGGVGYYPTSAIPFVHVDTDRVRSWPRLPRHELALLFPDGRTKHIPADGKPLTPADVHIAKTKHVELAQQIAAYHELRRGVGRRTQIASAWTSGSPQTPPTSGPQRIASAAPSRPHPTLAALDPAPAPKLLVGPQPARRPAIASRPSDEDRMKLMQLASLASLDAESPRLLQASFGPEQPPSSAQDLTTSLPVTRNAGEVQLAALASQADSEPKSRLNQFGWGAAGQLDAKTETEPPPTEWAAAPEYDDEHPEELFYRPFPIIPYLTETPSPDDPVLAQMVHPDVAKTFELLDQADALPPMRLRPEPQVVQLLWAQQFRGEAVPLARVFADREPSPDGLLTERPVRISSR